MDLFIDILQFVGFCLFLSIPTVLEAIADAQEEKNEKKMAKIVKNFQKTEEIFRDINRPLSEPGNHISKIENKNVPEK